MLIYHDFATSAIAKSLEASTTTYLCAGKTPLKKLREIFVQKILNGNMNFRNFDFKTLFYTFDK